MTQDRCPDTLDTKNSLPMEKIHPNPDQPRKHFDEGKIQELAESMATNGLAIPILVRPCDDEYQIVHGERRYRAAQTLAWTEIAAEVREIDADQAHWLSLVENVQREDLTPIEEALAYQERVCHVTHSELGKKIGKTRSYIAQKLRLLSLPPLVQDIIQHGRIGEGHARQLLRINGIIEKWCSPERVTDELYQDRYKEHGGITPYWQYELAWRPGTVVQFKNRVDGLWADILWACCDADGFPYTESVLDRAFNAIYCLAQKRQVSFGEALDDACDEEIFPHETHVLRQKLRQDKRSQLGLTQDPDAIETLSWTEIGLFCKGTQPEEECAILTDPKI